MKNTARIIQCDHSGAIVTEVIYYNCDRLLIKFFCCYSAISHEICGFDRSVSLARSTLKLPDTEQLIKIAINSADWKRKWYYVAAAPVGMAYTPPGWATHSFEAYGITKCKEVYLKDTWRLDLPEFTPEGETYKQLMKKNVLNIPKCLMWGDILDV